jgi:hypothetical protein
MPNCLNIGIVNLERAVMGTDTLRVCREEEGVVVHPLLTSVDVHEASYMRSFRGGEEVGCFEIEVFGIKIVGPAKVADEATTESVLVNERTDSPKWPSLNTEHGFCLNLRNSGICISESLAQSNSFPHT